MRIYEVVPGRAEAFSRFFRERLLPVQERHGARLVGRFESLDGGRVVALWAYESEAAYERIEAAVRADPDAAAAQEHRRAQLEPLVARREELLLRSTVPLEATALAGLAAGRP